MSTVRGIAGALFFGKELMDGKSVDEAKAAARAAMGELAPLVDPAIDALEDVARKRALRRARKEVQAKPAPRADDDGVTVIETTGEEVPEPRRGERRSKAGKHRGGSVGDRTLRPAGLRGSQASKEGQRREPDAEPVCERRASNRGKRREEDSEGEDSEDDAKARQRAAIAVRRSAGRRLR